MATFLSLFNVASPEPSAVADPARLSGQQRLDSAFSRAAQATGLPFDFFLTTATRESSLDVNAAASTSSARGPFQFIEQTWLAMMHEHGDNLGMPAAAQAIERHSDGRYRVADLHTREDILSLRHDPELSAVMTGLYVRQNAAELENALGRPVTVGEGYVAHVFGPSGGARLISLAEQQPNRVAAEVFPTQAAANRGLFYTRDGDVVSVRQLYDRLISGFSSEPIVPDEVAVATVPTEPRVNPRLPASLEPSGFASLPEAVPGPPDELGRRGMFSSQSNASTPFFAALYRPDGWQAPALAEEIVATHGRAPQPSGERSPSVPNPMSAPTLVGQPLDLIHFVESGRMVEAYRNPVQTAGGVSLVSSA